jgi:nicotinamidase-related amidase
MAEPLPRSPLLMSRHDTALLVVDVQERLIGAIVDHARLVWNIRRLLDGAEVLGLPRLATEQYPRGLGPTVGELSARLGPIPEKLAFSCGGCSGLFDGLQEGRVDKLLVVGIEAHVCVAQTVFDLLAAGFQVSVAADAIGSRNPLDAQIALRRMEAAGAWPTTTEAALFEWCQAAGTAEFKRISQLVRESAPE